jgi:hypothetical protein
MPPIHHASALLISGKTTNLEVPMDICPNARCSWFASSNADAVTPHEPTNRSPALQRGLALVGATIVLASGAQAAGFSPSLQSATMTVGDSLTFNGLFTTPMAGADKVDIFFVVDDTGSMGTIIGNAKAGATAILNGLPSTYRYGVASYDGDPSEGVSSALAYNRRTDLTTNRTSIINGINDISASGGGDFPEANLFALKQVAETSSWDAGSQRLVVWFGDAPGHVNTVSTSAAAAALKAAGVRTLAFNSVGAGSGIDSRDTSPAEPSSTRQASDIIAVTGGSLTSSFASLSAQQFVSTVLAQITRSTTTFDLDFISGFSGTGLSVDISCTDALGCADVSAGSTRSFAVTIGALEVGNYAFNVGARGFSDVQGFNIAVTPVPEPSTWALLAAGLGAIGAARRRLTRQR